jgi:hypothetical protein
LFFESCSCAAASAGDLNQLPLVALLLSCRCSFLDPVPACLRCTFSPRVPPRCLRISYRSCACVCADAQVDLMTPRRRLRSAACFRVPLNHCFCSEHGYRGQRL